MELELFNDELEKSLLSLLIQNGDRIFDVATKLKPEMFGSEPHRNIYRAMYNIQTRGLDVSAHLVVDDLRRQDLLDRSGGMDYIEYITRQTFNVGHLNEYVRKIQNFYKRRELLNINNQIPNLLSNEERADEVIARLDVKLNDLVSSLGSSDTFLIGDYVDETIEQIAERIKNPGIPGISTGISELDLFTGGLMPGDLWTVGARPQMGKSATLLHILKYVAMNGVGAIYFSEEMNRQQLIERALSSISNVPFQKIRFGNLDEEEFEKVSNADKLLKDIPLYIDTNYAADPQYVVSTVRKHKQLYDIKVVGIDYIQLLVERNADSTALLGNASRAFKLMSNELQVTTIMLSQLNRECEKREDKRPLLSDLRQSGNLEEDADIMAAIYRDEVYVPNSPETGKMEVILRKQRNGPIGTIMVNFDKDTVRIRDQRKAQSWDSLLKV